MKNFVRFCTVLAASAAILSSLSGNAFAQGGGSGGGGNGGGGNGGGGGNSSIPTGTLFTFDNLASFGGATPALSGDYTIANPIPGYYTWTTFKVNCKSKSLNLPDGTVVSLTLYTKDAATGEPVAPVSLGSVAVLNKTVQWKNISYAFTDYGLLSGLPATIRVMDKIVLTLPSGQIVGIGH